VKGTIYAVSVGYNGDQIDSHCWGPLCGKGDVGLSITLAGGEFVVCRQKGQDCPVMEAEMQLEDFPLPTRDGLQRFHLFARKLKKP